MRLVPLNDQQSTLGVTTMGPVRTFLRTCRAMTWASAGMLPEGASSTWARMFDQPFHVSSNTSISARSALRSRSMPIRRCREWRQRFR
jgi:hypothetical protein